jgi:hypothetical protein
LLLRTDIHRLFDRGYVTVDEQLRFKVSSRLRQEFNNGRHYYELEGRELVTPSSATDRPDPAALDFIEPEFSSNSRPRNSSEAPQRSSVFEPPRHGARQGLRDRKSVTTDKDRSDRAERFRKAPMLPDS